MLDLAKVRADDVVYDLGCGDGRMVIAAAKKYGTRGVGVDLDPARIREARANAKRAGVETTVTFEVGDLFETDIREATVVLLYLLPELNRRLKPKLFAELQPGARVVSHDWDMGRLLSSSSSASTPLAITANATYVACCVCACMTLE